jgi:hypothetical protein
MFSSNTTQVSGGYEIQRSLRFNSADSAYLNRTPASAGNRRTLTWSGWLKLSATGIQRVLSASSGSADDFLAFASDTLRFQITDSGGTPVGNLITTQVFRDYSSWYHIVVALDTTQATASDRMKMYVNGVQVTAFSTATYPAQNTDTLALNTAVAHYLSSVTGTLRYFDGYMTEVNFIDGQALTPSSFGEYNADTGVWQPKRYAGSYGTNGFYLNFSNNSNTTAATLGADYSGNGNNWTPNNFSVSAGAGNDSLVDVPTNWGVDTGVGGTVRGNYCTWNPLAKGTNGSGLTLSNGNLDGLTPSNAILSVLGTIGVSSGKWYWEVTPTADGNIAMVGIGTPRANVNSNAGDTGSQSWGYYGNGDKFFNATNTAYGATFTNNDVIGVALDMDAGTVVFYNNGASQGTAFTGLTGTILPMMGEGGTLATVAWNSNFGQRPFAYTAPSGFKALNTQNLPTPTIGATPATQAGKFFNPVLWTGNGSNPRAITGVGFQPDFSWLARRDIGYGFWLYDAVRGATKTISSQSTAAESTYQQLNSFDADGFTQAGSPDQGNNISGGSYIAWNWKANGAGVTNTAGSITSTVSANTTSGFSVVTYTGTGANATVGHGLGAAAQMVIVKRRDTTANWQVRHTAIAAANSIQLNLDSAAASATTVWNSTNPTSTVFSIGTDATVNASGGTYVAYAFAEVPGYSRFGSYTGNGSTDGPFVFTGMRPAYVMIKCSSDPFLSWLIEDATRSPSNASTLFLAANSSVAEQTGIEIDFCANGFKLRNGGNGVNGNNFSYVFAAFASAPQKFALAR